MSSDKGSLSNKILSLSYVVKTILEQINKIEDDVQIPIIEKLSQIKKIKQELLKVGTEIDSIKRSITILNTQNIN